MAIVAFAPDTCLCGPPLWSLLQCMESSGLPDRHRSSRALTDGKKWGGGGHVSEHLLLLPDSLLLHPCLIPLQFCRALAYLPNTPQPR